MPKTSKKPVRRKLSRGGRSDVDPNSRPITGAESRRYAQEARERRSRQWETDNVISGRVERPRRNPHPDTSSAAPVRTERTGGGDYHVYRKDSKPAKSFREAFRAARNKGQKTFTWNGRRYTTELA